MIFKNSFLLLLSSCVSALAECPYMDKHYLGNDVQGSPHVKRLLGANMTNGGGFIPQGGFKAVHKDLIDLMKTSRSFWPADFAPPIGPHYGGLFIRLAWHCAGSYRAHDGRGGCDGGRIRFSPELNWPDNGNLDKALTLLEPIKAKYGTALSWGDLIILSGNAAITSMGGPILGFCGGRIDDDDGSDSLKLGPSKEQEDIGACQRIGRQGKCLSVNGTALGPTTVGLIYVNPGGPVGGEGNPNASMIDIRTAFGRMGFNFSETVSLIGGGHAFGKMHGACLKPPCGDGKGQNTSTSGYEGAWTTIPTTWSNEYFRSLFGFNWTKGAGAGGKVQFFPFNKNGTKGPSITMLTTDLALTNGVYREISKKYAMDIKLLEKDFAHSWYHLTTSDMGPASRCIGDMVPPPQPFQSSLPRYNGTNGNNLPDYIPVRSSIQKIIDSNRGSRLAFINLAYRCAATFQATNFKGGCNGARIRFSPEKDWVENKGTGVALSILEPVKTMFPNISYADLIVLAGVTSLESMSDISLPFCGGRVDANNADNSGPLKPRYYSPAVVQVKDDFEVKGLTMRRGAALAARNELSSSYFKRLLAANNSNTMMFSREELALKENEFLPFAIQFAKNETDLISTFAAAWTYLMQADRFVDNRRNACTGVRTPTTSVK